MPLSKARDRKRKSKERARIRLDKRLSSLMESKPVQPKHNIYFSTNLLRDAETGGERILIDADGNPIPDYT